MFFWPDVYENPKESSKILASRCFILRWTGFSAASDSQAGACIWLYLEAGYTKFWSALSGFSPTNIKTTAGVVLLDEQPISSYWAQDEW